MNRMIPTKSAQTAPVDATTAPSGAARPDNGTDGETVPGVGSLYSGVLVQRPNKSLLADEPDGAGNANPGMLPMVTRGARRTGRVLGTLRTIRPKHPNQEGSP